MVKKWKKISIDDVGKVKHTGLKLEEVGHGG